MSWHIKHCTWLLLLTYLYNRVNLRYFPSRRSKIRGILALSNYMQFQVTGAAHGHAPREKGRVKGAERENKRQRKAGGASPYHRRLAAQNAHEGGQDKRRLVSDAAGGVLVDLVSVDIAVVHLVSAHGHGLRQVASFFHVHAPPVDGHQESRGLVVRHGAIAHALDPVLDQFLVQRLIALLSSDELLKVKHCAFHETFRTNFELTDEIKSL